MLAFAARVELGFHQNWEIENEAQNSCNQGCSRGVGIRAGLLTKFCRIGMNTAFSPRRRRVGIVAQKKLEKLINVTPNANPEYVDKKEGVINRGGVLSVRDWQRGC